MINRQYKRKALSLSVNILFEGDVTECKVLDISVGGAKIISRKSFEKRSEIELQFDNFGDFQSQVMWGNKGNYGLKFLDDPAVIAEALAALALYG